MISAGIQFCVPQNLRYFALLHKLILRINWIPACAGMTEQCAISLPRGPIPRYDDKTGADTAV